VKLSCGILIIDDSQNILLGHVTGQNHWDIPKGGIDEGETPLQCAIRETREEFGINFDGAELEDLGQMHYTAKKNLHLFLYRLPQGMTFDARDLKCTSSFLQNGKEILEMDGFSWYNFSQAFDEVSSGMSKVLKKILL
jgi:putative (di)nucleoside polyphosphate hydrolase